MRHSVVVVDDQAVRLRLTEQRGNLSHLVCERRYSSGHNFKSTVFTKDRLINVSINNIALRGRVKFLLFVVTIKLQLASHDALRSLCKSGKDDKPAPCRRAAFSD